MINEEEKERECLSGATDFHSLHTCRIFVSTAPRFTLLQTKQTLRDWLIHASSLILQAESF